MNTKLIKEYKKMRAPHVARYAGNGAVYHYQAPASQCIEEARRIIKIAALWPDHENVTVRLRYEPDSLWGWDDIEGDMFDPQVNSDIQPHVLKRQQKEYRDLVEREGVWILMAQVRTPPCPHCKQQSEWRTVDSIGGIVGTDGDSGYETDVQIAALKAAGLWEE